MKKAAATILAATALLAFGAVHHAPASAAATMRAAKPAKAPKPPKQKGAQAVAIEKPKTVIPMDAAKPVIVPESL
ncbi:MAG: hypothetical protein QM681_17320, partial [Novosphingobium sp.]